MAKPKRKRDSCDDARDRLALEAKRVFAKPDPDERAERAAFVELTKKSWARDNEPDFPEVEEFFKAERRGGRGKPRT